MQLSELENIAEHKNKDFIVAGMVTSVQNLMTKTGKPFGRFTLEDYNGSYQFTLFGKDYENFRKFLYQDYYLLIRGKIAPRPYNDKEFEPRIASIMQLAEAQETLIKEMTLTLPVKEITAEVVHDLTNVIKNSAGNILFRVKVTDPENEVSLGLYSRSFRINLSADLIRFCEEGGYKFSLV